jgi:tetratricopeptide (TPR) repeat protein
MRKNPRRRAAVLGIALALACTPPEERAEQARTAVRDALQRGDREAALAAVERLRGELGGSADETLELAVSLVAAGEAGQAVWLLEAAVERHPDRDDLRVALGRAALLTQNPDLARRAVEPIGADSPSHGDALLLQAQAELGLGRLEAGLARLEEASALYPDRHEAGLARVRTLLRERRYDEARTAAAEVRGRLDAANAEHVAALAALELVEVQLDAAQGEVDAAVARLDARVQSQPGDLAAWQLLLQLLGRERQGSEALARVDAALEADDAPVELFGLRASLLGATGRREEATAALREYLIRADSVQAYAAMPTLASAVADDATVLELLEEGVARHPGSRELRILRTEVQLALGHVEEAEAALRDLERQRRDEPALEYLRARVDLARGDAARAASRLERVAPRFDRPSTQFWLGQALEALGDRDGAALRYGAAARRSPDWSAPHFALLSLARQRGDWVEVAAQGQRLLRRSPATTGVWLLLAEALVQQGDGERAEQVARSAAEAFPERPEPSWLRAAAVRMRGDTEGALAILDETRAQFGASPELEAERALTLGLGGRVEEAVAIARTALLEHPESARLHGVLAGLLFEQGRGTEGAREVDRALALDPEELTPLLNRLNFRAATGAWETARRDAAHYLELRPDTAHAYFVLGLARDRLGDSEGAEAAYRRAAGLDARAAAPRNNLALLLAARGDLDAATQVAQEGYAVASDDPVVLDTLGWLYLRRDLHARAAAILERAHAADPAQPDAQLHLAQAYVALGRGDEARTLLTALADRTGASHPLRPEIEETLRAAQ